jgi:hypothetical protein
MSTVQKLVKDKKIHEARAFNFTYRYIDDVANGLLAVAISMASVECHFNPKRNESQKNTFKVNSCFTIMCVH